MVWNRVANNSLEKARKPLGNACAAERRTGPRVLFPPKEGKNNSFSEFPLHKSTRTKTMQIIITENQINLQQRSNENLNSSGLSTWCNPPRILPMFKTGICDKVAGFILKKAY